ncbi:S8 family serine peptidase [Halobacillus litoralis]|uniref:S8 family serine peptidase n=1 Tax=Halobacillus litoralis TaxID=45668 RepID=A0A845F7R6_9BACI|nr:cell wall-binding repeat-containing protein [Halobacillus litoralis]MYL69891.1 S8 family serine peptidase [Halobacillus litoralis]
MVSNKKNAKKKALSVFASAAIVASSFAGVTTYNPGAVQAETSEVKTFNTLLNYKEVVSLANNEENVQELVIIGNGKVDATKQLEKLGVKVKQNHRNYGYLADVPTNKIFDVVKLDAVRTVGDNAEVQLAPTPEDSESKGNSDVNKEDSVSPDQLETHPAAGVDDFHGKFDGEGTTVAIIDSGPDPGHESFTDLPEVEDGEDAEEVFAETRKYGDSKIVNVRDYTVSNYHRAETGVFPVEDRYKKFVEGVEYDYFSEGDVVFMPLDEDQKNDMGITEEGDVYYGQTHFNALADLNGDGEHPEEVDGEIEGDPDNFGVLLIGDELYIDTDMDGDFSDETAYENEEAGTFDVDVTDETVGANFRVNDLDYLEDRFGIRTVNLFTDFNGHGSHVAGITAANGPLRDSETGAVAGEGVAPEADLVGMRVFEESGGAYTWSIQKAMIDAALPEDMGGFDADVANLSLGSLPDLNIGEGSYGELMTLLSDDYDIVFVTSAGNDGPGIDSVGSPGDVGSVISVGAYINSEMWAKEYGDYPYGKDAEGNPLPGEGLWYFSSVGPNEIGDQKPDLVAPGSAFAAEPVHQHGGLDSAYGVKQGTSMSAPYVAGAVALLKSAALKDRLPFDYELAKEALVQTSRELDGYNRAQQGAGLINVPAAYEYMREHFVNEVKDVDVTVYHGEKVAGGPGLYVRNKDIPETVEVLVENPSDEEKNLEITATHDWFTPSVSELTLGAGEHEYITVSYDASKLETGVNAGNLIFNDPSTHYVEARSAQTIMTGYEFTEDNKHRFRANDEVQSSQTKGYTFDVESGLSELRFSLNALTEGGDYEGRVRMMIFNPNGTQVNEYVGYAGYGSGGLDVEDFVVPSPEPGVWEVHVYGTTAPEEGKEVHEYTLEAVAQDVVASPGRIDLGKVSTSQEFNEEVTFTNYLKDSAEVKFETVGFSGPISKTITGEVTQNLAEAVDDGDLIDIEIENNVSLSVDVSPETPADLDLFLLNEEGDIVASSATGSDSEAFSVTGLPDGNYQIAVDNFGDGSSTVNYTLNMTEEKVLSYDTTEETKGSVSTDAGTTTLGVGESVDVPVSITTPDEPIKGYAALYMLDANTDEVLDLVPVTTDADVVDVLSGATRTETAIEISKDLYPDGGADTVIVTTGYDFPDALSAGPLASATNAPIIPVNSKGTLDEKALEEIERLGAKNVYVLGGTGAVDKEVFSQLNTISIASDNIERLSDDTRYGTNLKIVKELQSEYGFEGNGVFLATGKNYADALSAASIAGANGMPIVLTNGEELSEEALEILENEDVYVAGGTGVVSDEVLAQADEVALSVERLSGANRYGTLVALLKEFGHSTDQLYAASGANYPDALAAAPLVTANDGLLLLVDDERLPKEVDAYLTKYVYTNDISSVTVLGGDGAVSPEVREALQKKVTE